MCFRSDIDYTQVLKRYAFEKHMKEESVLYTCEQFMKLP